MIQWMIELLMVGLLVYVSFRYRGPERFYLVMECILLAALGFAVLSLT